MRHATCAYHCRECDRHFASLAAFDAHRFGPYSDRQCETPSAVEDLEGETGECRIVDPELPEVGVPIYFLAADRERVRERFVVEQAA